MLKIRELASSEISPLRDFAPPEWKTDLSTVFGRHFGQPYFIPVVALLDGAVVGCANVLLQGRAGWLGNIIVQPSCRGRGIGTALTSRLLEILRQHHVETPVLIATDMGEPVYRKLGFVTTSTYVFLAGQPGLPEPGETPGVRLFQPDDEPALLALDQLVTCEKRAAFLHHYFEGGHVHLDPSGRLDGYYLPALGTGLVIAANDGAGLALLHHKIGHAPAVVVVPAENRAALDFLHARGFTETSRVPRMAIGPDLPWQPQHVYARGSGFCG